MTSSFPRFESFLLHIVRYFFVMICTWFDFQSHSQVQSSNDLFANTLSASCKIHKVVLENDYGNIKFLVGM